jgi:HlyD family secretion protein
MSIALKNSANAAAGTLLLAMTGCSDDQASTYPGYVEGEFVYISAPVDGRLQHLYVARGEQVSENAALYALEGKDQQSQRSEAAERFASARAQVENLKSGRRPDERKMTQAQVDQARAASELAKSLLERDEQLFAKGLIPIMRLEQSRADATARAAQLVEASAQLRLASESIGRREEVNAAQGDAQAAAAVLDHADWQLEQRIGVAPSAALVQDTFYSPGEWVPATRPIVSLLPPQNIRLRLYMPETALAALKIGQVMSVRCDGCPAHIEATVSYISTEPEYTPPVLFSKENRARLVYRVDAKPSADALQWLKPGLPVDMHVEPGK